MNTKIFQENIADKLFFSGLKLIGYALLKVFFSFEVINSSIVPRNNPFILTANHFSFMDPPVLQIACPRRIYFFMTEKYYNPLWSRWFFQIMHAIPLREKSAYNISPIKTGLKLLENGKVIGIFPEGGISKMGIIQPGKPGTLLLAQKAKVPILPAFISGTYQALPRQAKFFRKAKIKVTFGNPITYNELSDGLDKKLGLEVATKNLIQKIKELSQAQEGGQKKK
ncbi:MAG: 1-acyl-sn-glycerol-3-phosphate acyltransferase [Desulfobacterota bacterium]|nr:1-acyl-sn-glycerol-3-phosphate acyltransferase [Thermodesulfobacteriota bacterium]